MTLTVPYIGQKNINKKQNCDIYSDHARQIYLHLHALVKRGYAAFGPSHGNI